MLKKDKLKAASADFEADPEAAKEHAMKQEFKRAEVSYFLVYFSFFKLVSYVFLLD